MARHEGASWQQHDTSAWGGNRSDSEAYYEQLRESGGLYGGHNSKNSAFDPQRLADRLSGKAPFSATNQPAQPEQRYQGNQTGYSNQSPTPGKLTRADVKRTVEANSQQRKKQLQDMKKAGKSFFLVNVVTTMFALVTFLMIMGFLG